MNVTQRRVRSLLNIGVPGGSGGRWISSMGRGAGGGYHGGDDDSDGDDDDMDW
jgi:hypothetical protein